MPSFCNSLVSCTATRPRLAVFRSIYLDAVPAAVLPHDAAAVLYDTIVRFLRAGLRTAAERALEYMGLAVLNRLAHGRLDESGKALALAQDGFDVGAQCGLDADLRQDGGLHSRIVVLLRCTGRLEGSRSTGASPLLDGHERRAACPR